MNHAARYYNAAFVYDHCRQATWSLVLHWLHPQLSKLLRLQLKSSRQHCHNHNQTLYQAKNSINFSIGTHITAFLGSFAHRFKSTSVNRSPVKCKVNLHFQSCVPEPAKTLIRIFQIRKVQGALALTKFY